MGDDRDILPDCFQPEHYTLLIQDLDFEHWTYHGHVSIQGILQRPTTCITLNTLELDLTTASLTVGQQTIPSTSHTTDASKQRTTLVFDAPLPVTDATGQATLAVAFRGRLNHNMAGFYRSQYKPPAGASPAAASVPRDADWHYMLSTQFESCDARRAFPCFDEPNRKATFDLALEVPADLVALSNMPVKNVVPGSAGAGAGKKTVYFERTPVMSTYLLAWAVGDFEYIEAWTDRRYQGRQLPVRVYTTRGLKEQGRWALDHAPKVIDFFSERFGTDYPLPKSDILAAHEFTHGAMENWGLVTYRMTAILFDEKLSEARFRNRIAYVVAHELAHQWFGNLVTMDWWDELWLNEGFATWAGWLAMAHMHPEWDIWAQWMHEVTEDALVLDSIRASHPIQVPVRDALGVNQIFDKISYLKGGSMIRQLAAHLGEDTFLRGIALYLQKHAYGNAKTEALWSALSQASGTDVNTLMGPWIQKMGHPVVRIEEPEAGRIVVRQSRFLQSGDVTAEDDTTTWWVPLMIQGAQGVDGIDASSALVTKGPETFAVDADWYLVNAGATGFYRVQYPTQRLQALSAQLGRLTLEDKISITGSAAALAFAGDADTASLLTFLRGMGNETHYRVWSQALDAIGTIKSIFGDDEAIRTALETFTLDLIQKPLQDVGWEPEPGENFNKSLLRKRLLLASVANQHPAILSEAAARFAAYTTNAAATPATAVHPDLRLPIYRAAIVADPARAVAALQAEWAQTAAVDGKEVCLQALGHVADARLVTHVLLPFLFDTAGGGGGVGVVAAGDVHMLAGAMAANRVARPLLWGFFRDNWARVMAKVGGNPIVLDRLIRISLGQFADLDTLAEINAFFAQDEVRRDAKAFDRTLATIKETIRTRAAYRAREGQRLGSWLREQELLRSRV